ncbi:MAG: 50S ribosomal protein L25/general stress protein Ctc [Gammaproteobacteria bacterium]|nr:50S ribosomal protein L25/general stress protein Ctc [Rhodocyclaceae bacterium]MBU3909163.1 50S ribosomal protein L25/general stress protein Ctc [Gammaproteobacteria bacterium]MBU3988328.1 50S ribosomal protein L25/general stress protein Ctc [Gammaproteobacteria bacterium]MBU4005677.1 50S ribosomal protein L25/general stress protein Ctc [Gammaproteobacteria bacterium]MBU4020770.1 50S ribosomal protein L25/general stress protein Ctc [Gammaproteobacteria bacterium]
MQFEINANKRELQGSSASRRLRRAGRVPGIIYGGPTAPQMIEFEHNVIFQALRKEAFRSSVVNMSIDGKVEMCLLRDVQMHAFKLQIKHVDFQRIDATHEIHQKVPLHFINAEIAPGVKLGGGMAHHGMNELDVTCLPKDLPTFIEVDLKDLNVGESVYLSQIKLPAGVTAAFHGEGDPVVAGIVMVGATTTEEVETEAAPIETQVTTEKKPAAEAEKKAEKK